MGYRSISTLAAVAAASLAPAVSHAATITLAYSSVQYANNANFTGATTIPIVGGTATLPSTGYFRFNLGVTVAGNVNTSAASAPGLDSDGNPTVQPALLGLGSYGASVSDSNVSVAAPVQSAAANGTTEAVPKVNIDAGTFNPTLKGGINPTTGLIGDDVKTQIQAGINAGNFDASDSSNFRYFTFGAAGSQNAFSQLTYQMLSGGSVVLAASFTPATIGLVAADPTAPGDAVTAPKYTVRTFNAATDQLVGPGNLTVTVTPEPASLGLLGVAAAGLVARRRRA